VFLLMPRGAPGALFELPGPLGRAEAVTGFSDVLRLTDIGSIRQDRRVVMEVRIEQDGRNLGAEGFRAYLRGRVYGSYRGGEWFALRGRVPWWTGGLSPAGPAPLGENVVVQQVTMDQSLLPTVFAIAPTVGIELPPGAGFLGNYPETRIAGARRDSPLRYTAYSFASPYTPAQAAYLARLRDPPRSRIGGPGVKPQPGSTGLEPSAEDEIPPGVRLLARQWCADLLPARDVLPADDPDRGAADMKIAERIARRLSSHCAYTLDLSQADPDRDPVEDFLLHTRRGHCQLFASAMTLMCRSVGVRARVAAGFLAADYSPAAGGYLVRAADAHAWCEVYTDQTDWLVVDPTPAGALQRTAGALEALGDFWTALGFLWKTRIIGYGEHDRRTILEAVLRGLRDARAFLRRAGQAAWQVIIRGEFERGVLLSALPALALGLAALTLAFLLAALLRRRRRHGRIPVHPSLPRFYHRFVRLLRRRGHRQRTDQTTREFLLEVADRTNLPAGDLGLLADLLYRIRWGGLRPSARALEHAERAVRRLADALRGA
jgi:transglutaminase-like putative cysteine protease